MYGELARASGNCPEAPLTSSEVQSILQSAAASLDRPDMTIAVVDRPGNILGIYRKSATDPRDQDLAVSLARTGAFFSHEQAPLSSRTVRFISGKHFPPGIANTPNAALYGIENTNRGCELNLAFDPGMDVPPAKSVAGGPCNSTDTSGCGLGITTGKGADVVGGVAADLLDLDATRVNPGGIAIYRGCNMVGGIGVVVRDQLAPATLPTHLQGAEAYWAAYPDVKADPYYGATPQGAWEHYQKFGQGEGRTWVGGDPGISALVQGAEAYWAAYPDVKADPYYGATPQGAWEHYQKFGQGEGRTWVGGDPGISQPMTSGVPVLNTSAPALLPSHSEFAAIAGVSGAGFQIVPEVGLPLRDIVVFLDGIALPFVEQTTRPAGEFADPAPSGSIVFGPFAGSVAPEGYLLSPRAGSHLTVAEVDQIVQQSIQTANAARAGIRLPFGSRTKMMIAVGDTDGTILAVYRMPDATIFSIDVAISKARNVAYFSSFDPLVQLDLPEVPLGTAITNRTLSFGAQPLFPPGIDGTNPGPFFDLFQRDTSNPCSQGFQPPNANQSGVVFFPGSVPLYKNGILVGGLGISGDGVEQDDVVSNGGGQGFLPPEAIRADRVSISGVRLPFLKFNRNPFR
jgi:uncharacterized protein GlcG (DUF336 family)